MNVWRKSSSAWSRPRPSSVRSDSQNDQMLIACRPSSSHWRRFPGKLGQLRREDRLKLRLGLRQRHRATARERGGERLVNAGRPPARGHLLQDPRPLAGEDRDPRAQRQAGVDPFGQRSQDLEVAAIRLDQQRLHVSELLPDGAHRHPGPLGDARGGRPEVTLGVQRAHGVDDRAARAERPRGAAIRRLAVTGRLAEGSRPFDGILHTRHNSQLHIRARPRQALGARFHPKTGRKQPVSAG